MPELDSAPNMRYLKTKIKAVTLPSHFYHKNVNCFQITFFMTSRQKHFIMEAMTCKKQGEAR